VKYDNQKKPLRLNPGLYDMMMEQKKGTQPRLAVPLLLPALPVLMPPRTSPQCRIALLLSPGVSELKLPV